MLLTGLTTLLSLPPLSPSSQEKYHIVGLCCVAISLSLPWCTFFWRISKHPVDFSLCITYAFPLTRNSGWPTDSPKSCPMSKLKSKNPAFPFSMNEAEGAFHSCQIWQMRFNLFVCYRSRNKLSWKGLHEVQQSSLWARLTSMLDQVAPVQLWILIKFLCPLMHRWHYM